MAENKLASPKSILILIFVILFTIVAALTVVAFLSSVKKSSPVVVKPTEEPTITSTPESSIASTSVPSPTPEDDGVDLGTYTTKELLGENINYSVYLLDQAKDLPGRKGKIVVYDKNKKVAIPITGLFSIFGATIVTDDGERKYVALSNGTSTSRDIVILSLSEKKQIIDNFCSGSQIYFWEKYIIYESCDSLVSRPWGDGEASSIKRTDLISKQVKVLFKADILHDFWINKIDGDTLFYTEYSVEKETDWNIPDARKIEAKIYNLAQ